MTQIDNHLVDIPNLFHPNRRNGTSKTEKSLKNRSLDFFEHKIWLVIIRMTIIFYIIFKSLT